MPCTEVQPQAPLRIAIAQMPMQWTVQANGLVIADAMAIAAGQGARICVFPELAVTGFHREIKREAEASRVESALDSLRALCAGHGMACVVGAPTFGESARPRNSHVHIDERGEIAATVHKNGLTPSEATFFDAGSDRPVACLQGLACTSVLCREVEDLAAIAAQLPPGRAELVFWPSLVGRPPTAIPDPDHVEYLPLAQALARQSQAFVVQCNWPNALNTPDASHIGGSKVFGRDGEILFALPLDRSGVAVFELGRSDFAWTELPMEICA